MTISNIQAEIRALCDTDSTELTDAVLLRRVNAAYEEIVGKIMAADGKWQFDDSNYTDLPIGTTTLVNGQQDYQFASSQLAIERVEVLDNSGDWHLLEPIDEIVDVKVALGEYQSTNGLPTQYWKRGGSIFLTPIPATGSVTLSGGLKVYFQRTASIYTSGEQSTGTKEPGFASPFHILIVYKAALMYCVSYKRDRVPMLVKEIDRVEKDLLAFYSRRTRDEIPKIGITIEDNQ